jgi:CheY-like chemotaxis protein
MKSAAPISPNILLIDESRDGLLVRRALLEELGCRVEAASDCEAGLKLYQSANFDVVVTGHRVPGLNGIDLIARIRRVNPNARVILVCGLIEPLGLTEENTGADAVIGKNAKEPVQLGRWVKRLTSRAPGRKPPAKQERIPARASGIAR